MMFGMSCPKLPLNPISPIEYDVEKCMTTELETVICFRGKDNRLYETMSALKEADRRHLMHEFFRKHGATRQSIMTVISMNWDELRKILNEN